MTFARVDSDYVLPIDLPWSIVEVEADDTGAPLNHYVYVYDGAGNLTVYRNKVADAPISHTPSGTYTIGPNLYDGSGALVVAYEAKLFDVAFAQADVDSDYGLYFAGGTPIVSETISETELSHAVLAENDIPAGISSIAGIYTGAAFDIKNESAIVLHASSVLKNYILSENGISVRLSSGSSSDVTTIADIYSVVSGIFDTVVITTAESNLVTYFDLKAYIENVSKSLYSSRAVQSAGVSCDTSSEALISFAVSSIFGAGAEVISVSISGHETTANVSGLSIVDISFDMELIIDGIVETFHDAKVSIYEKDGVIEEIVLDARIIIEKTLRSKLI